MSVNMFPPSSSLPSTSTPHSLVQSPKEPTHKGTKHQRTHILRRIIRHPTNKRNLAPRPLPTLQLILDIKDRITAADPLFALLVLALGVEQLFAEDGVVRVGRGLFDDDFLVVVGDFVDDPFGGFAELEVVEGLDAFGGDGDTG